MKPALDPRRKKELAKIHVAKKQLALDEDTYRSVLIRVAGKSSAGDLDQAGRTKVLEHFKSLGFSEVRGSVAAARQPSARAAGRIWTRPKAESAEAGKMRALWLALYQLGEVQDASEAALARYAERMTGRAALQWLDQRDVAKVINTLRAWCERVGYAAPSAADVAFINVLRANCGLDAQGAGFAAKLHLIKVLWPRARRGAVSDGQIEGWLMMYYRISDLWALSPEDADNAIGQLGACVRALKERP